MKLSPQDLQKLKIPFLILALSLIVMTLFVFYTEDKKLTIEKELTMEKGQLQQARQRYQTSGEEKETIIKYLPVYQRLIGEGFIGEERRIEWVDGLRSIHQQHKLFGINYSIGMQEDFKPTYMLPTGPFTLRRSVMKLELSMLHEGDLLTLIDALDQQQGSPFILRDCEIVRQTPVISTTLTANMVANCELDWLTIKEPQSVTP